MLVSKLAAATDLSPIWANKGGDEPQIIMEKQKARKWRQQSIQKPERGPSIAESACVTFSTG
jgi:hypothetical protein